MVGDKRFYKVKICLMKEGFLNITQMSRTAIYNNGKIFNGRIFPDFLKTFVTVLARHVQIKEQQVNMIEMKKLDQLLSILHIRNLHERIFLFNDPFKQQGMIPVIVGHQNVFYRISF